MTQLETTGLPTVADRLRAVEREISQALELGWRHAADTLPDLAGEADDLDALGLPTVAGRLRALASAPDAVAALDAAAWALAACQQVSLRLPASRPTGDWRSLGEAFPPRRTARTRLLPVARMALGEREAWACLRLAGSLPSNWLLLAPPTSAQSSPTAAVASASGMPTSACSTASTLPTAPWLVQPLRGHLRWQGRYPLGPDSDVEHYTVERVEWLPAIRSTSDPIFIRGALRSGSPHWGGAHLNASTGLQLRELSPSTLDAWSWPDDAAREACRALVTKPTLALVWASGATEAPAGTPLALIRPPALLRQARLVHLVAGGPSDPILDAAP